VGHTFGTVYQMTSPATWTLLHIFLTRGRSNSIKCNIVLLNIPTADMPVSLGRSGPPSNTWCPPEPTCQTACWSVQSFLQGAISWLTHTHTRAYTSVAIRHIYMLCMYDTVWKQTADILLQQLQFTENIVWSRACNSSSYGRHMAC